MCDFEFNLPLNKESLLESSDSYFVKSVCIVSQIRDQLKLAREALHYDGPEAVLNHFDTYYSVIYHGEKLNIDVIQSTLKELTKPCQQLSVYLESILEENEIAQEIQLKTLNILKMLMYLFSQMTILLENKIDTKNRNDLNVAKKGMKGGKAKAKKAADDDFDIESKKKHLNLLMKILQLPIYKLWDPPVCEEQFNNLIADMCFSYLINPSVKPEKEMWQTIFYIFGILIKNYSYSMTFTVRLTQAIKDHDHLEAIVPGGIKILVEEFNCISLVRELVRELTEWQSDENYQDAPGSRHCSVILIEMTALMPSLMLPEVVYLLKYLNNNSYTLRNCILSIITEVILTVLTNENITDEQIEIRNKLLNKLKVHVCDVNAHVRSKVLQQWARLHMETAIPKDMQAEIVKKTSGRLHDKGSLVRKSAIQLMTTFLRYNPFAASLDYDFYNTELTQEIEKCNKLTSDNVSNDMMEKMKNKEVEWNSMKDEIEAAIKKCLEKEKENENDNESDEEMDVETTNKSKVYVKELIMSGKYEDAFAICREFIRSNPKSNAEMNEMDEDKVPNFYLTFMQTIYTDLNKDAEDLFQINLNRLAQLTPEQVEEIKKCEENIKYLNDVVNFLNIMHNDVFPSIKNLLKSATMSDVNESVEFLITAHQFKLKKSDEGLAAMLTQMNTTEQDRKKVVIDAYRNVFLTFDGPREEKAATIVRRLINLLKNINAADVYYLSNVIMQWADKGDLEHSIIQELWHMFIGQITNLTEDDRIAVLQLLAMIARGRKTVIERNINLVAELVFSDKCLKDPRYLIFGCEMIGIMEDDIDVNSKNPSFRVVADDPMWQHLLEKLIAIFKRKDPYCHSCITAALELIYKICQKPDTLSTKLIKSIVHFLKDPNGNVLTDGKMDPKYLALFCHVLGEIAIRQFTFLDTTVFKELKRRNNIKEETKKSQKKNKNLNISKASASRTPNVHNTTGDDPEESYLEGAQADDVDAEYILNVCEREIVCTNLLGNFVSLLAHIVRHPHRFLCEELQACAVQALMRFMIVSSTVCTEYLQLVMTVLERSKYASVKNNIFIAIADLLHRFPNVIEPWAQQIFRVVKDEDETVRMTAVSILSKLIMEDMLRVKGTIADLALCIVDKSETIVQMTEEFFHLLAQKGNTIYNVLPDIISRLSNDKEQIDQETFKKVMTFLVQLISKDKHIESLVEKLCLRFKLSDKERVWRDLAYCLTLLTYNEKSLLRLEENFAAYKQCLEDDTVYELLISIVNKYKNNSKEEIKIIIKKLDQLIRTGEAVAEETELNETTAKTTKKKPAKRGRGKKARVQFSDSDD